MLSLAKQAYTDDLEKHVVRYMYMWYMYVVTL